LRGRLDNVSMITDAFFFARGLDPGDLRYTVEQAIRDPRRDRRADFLFMPGSAALRADRHFERLVTKIGLDRYWAESRTAPDYRRRGSGRNPGNSAEIGSGSGTDQVVVLLADAGPEHSNGVRRDHRRRGFGRMNCA
jgi:hypothetical protein